MNPLLSRLRDKEVLVRLNAFILSYFGWIAFGVLYGYIGRWSVDITRDFLKLPLTSKSLVLGLLDYTRSLVPLYTTLRWVYYFGFAGSIGFMVLYVLLYLRDLQTSDELLARYLMAYAGAGTIYLLVHIHAPHYVYHIPGYSMENTLLTRQEFVLPSLHNTFAAINIITIWKYRKRLGGKVLIGINTLIPFATVFLGHHWIYDVLTGFLLAWAVSRVTDGWAVRIPQSLYRLELKSLGALTMFNFVLATLMLLIALDPQKWLMVIRSILGQP
ncbi:MULTISPECIES: phosphatase PAP2 family protein [Thermococcus]|uniref:Membrane-associated phospholipid phosphatase n=1 Tax=Thermococcus nautili TaxID=195522 RepID=W8PKJ5_9EURY|nr:MULTISPECIES: phosphatase PAP2 family protein [Thermococcus]AHL22614.1 Membrane-associated phospholipid phosphatase [Thermococcus nautili]NJE48128.1 phosphatase PAP2 family protein [Thermococcus sp. 9N3]CAI1493340.1 Membrane-associated phospholipid phosphatase [Thermococcus nautili]